MGYKTKQISLKVNSMQSAVSVAFNEKLIVEKLYILKN